MSGGESVTDVLNFMLCSVFVMVLIALLCGTVVGYYFQKKYEYEVKKLGLIGKALTAKKEEK